MAPRTGIDDDLAVPAVGVLGTGRMGTAMARRLMAAGERVMVWNRTPAKAAPLVEEGAVWTDAPAGLGRCAVVFVVVTDSPGASRWPSPTCSRSRGPLCGSVRGRRAAW